MEDWPKPLSELDTRTSHFLSITLTHAGKQGLMEKSYERFKASAHTHEKLDFAYTFFDHAFHLKEWVRKFSGLKNFDAIWESKYSGNKYFKYCRDFCNVSKHFRITMPSVTSEVAVFQMSKFMDGKESSTYYIRFADQYMPMEFLMDQMVLFWSEFFRSEL